MNTQNTDELLEEISHLRTQVQKLKKQKRYGLVWEDKPELFDTESKNALPILIDKGGKFKDIISNKEENFNVLIEGDNYHSLSVLKYTHRNKIDVIYIDPPYNTGNKDFIYNDHIVDKEDSFRHSKWLSFMSKRLHLARDLLVDDGVIFISIDDNEQSQLKLLCDEIFGHQNFVENFIWEKNFAPKNDNKYISTSQEYLLLYAKNKSNFKRNLLPREEKHNKGYTNPDEDLRGPWSSGTMLATSFSAKYVFPIKKPNGDEALPPKGRCWRYSEEKTGALISDNRVWFGSKGSNTPRIKRFLSEVQDGIVPTSILKHNEIASGQDGTNELKNIFQEQLFDFPKPTKLIKHLFKISSSKNSMVLDFMAGSGTTGHAVLDLNKEDGGSRKFILCTNNENKICEDVTYKRIKRVSQGYKNSKGEKVEGLGGNLKYLKTDFIAIDSSIDDLKEKIVEASTQILCLKEGTFNEKDEQEKIKVFENSERYTAILFDTFYLNEFKDLLNTLTDKPISVYVFAYDKNFSKEEFSDINPKIDYSVEPIPEKLLETYQEIFNF